MKTYTTLPNLASCSLVELIEQKARHDQNDLEEWEKIRIEYINKLIKEKT